MIAKDTGGNVTPVPPGTYMARCCAVIDLGTQTSTFSGETKSRRTIRIAWELAGPKAADGKPMMIGRMYGLSLHEKASLRKDLQAWRGRPFTEDELKGFEMKNVLGKACMVTVVHEKKGNDTHDNVAAVTAMPAGMAAPDLQSPAVFFYIDAWDATVYSNLPDWMKKKISVSPEGAAKLGYKPMGGSPANGVSQAEADGEIPF